MTTDTHRTHTIFDPTIEVKSTRKGQKDINHLGNVEP